jgi:hypothetical protein
VGLVELRTAFETGELTRGSCCLIIDNDQVYAYADDEGKQKIFDEHPYDLLREALDLLGIPWDNA